MSTPTPRPVFVIGSFVMACCWFTPRLPTRGEHVHATRFLMEPGGKGLNVAVALKRLGAQVHLLLGVGDDPAAEALRALLHQEGLSSDHVHRFDGPSGHGVGLIDDAGEHVIAVHAGANHRLGRGQLRAAAADLASSAVVYGQFEAPDEVLATAFQQGRRSGARTVLNPSPWRRIDADVLAQVDTLLLNEHEAAAMWGLPPDGFAQGTEWMAAVEAWREGHRDVELILTLGAAGCLHWPRGVPAEAGAPFHHPARAVDATDTTGCGDAFAAAWCLGLAEGAEANEALTLANLAGAWVASRPGVLAALPTRSELAAWAGAQP